MDLGTPYLYKVKVDLYQEINGSSDGYQLIDTEETEYGFRWVKVKETTSDPTSGGLYVNGQYTKVQGVDLHHDSGALGAASYSDAYDREFDKLMARVSMHTVLLTARHPNRRSKSAEEKVSLW